MKYNRKAAPAVAAAKSGEVERMQGKAYFSFCIIASFPGNGKGQVRL